MEFLVKLGREVKVGTGKKPRQWGSIIKKRAIVRTSEKDRKTMEGSPYALIRERRTLDATK